jgi:hypothetical protein
MVVAVEADLHQVAVSADRWQKLVAVGRILQGELSPSSRRFCIRRIFTSHANAIMRLQWCSRYVYAQSDSPNVRERAIAAMQFLQQVKYCYRWLEIHVCQGDLESALYDISFI